MSQLQNVLLNTALLANFILFTFLNVLAVMQQPSSGEQLDSGCTQNVTFGVDFCDTTQPLHFQLCTSKRAFNVSVKVPVGELIKPIVTSQDNFIKQQGKLAGMNENRGKVSVGEADLKLICSRVTQVVNVARVPSTQDNVVRLAGKTAHGGSFLLVTVELTSGGEGKLCVNCDKMVICSIVFKEIKQKLTP